MAGFNPDDLLTARGRAKLKPRPQNAPYFRMLAKGQHIGFRPSESGGPGAWVLRYRHPDSGKIEHVALGAFSTYDEAKAEADSLLSKIIKGVDVKAKPTVKQACQEYIEHKRQRAGDEKAEEYRERLERYMFFADDVDTSKAETDDPRRIGDIQLAKLRRQDVEQWFAGVSKGRAPSTANRYFNDLRAVLNLAYKNSLVADGKAWAIEKHGNAERARVDAYLTKRERRMIIDRLNPDDDYAMPDLEMRSFCQFLALTGLRPGAVAALKVRDFDPRRKELAINKDKAGGGRVIQLSDKAVLIAKALTKHAAGADDWLFRVPIQVPSGEPDEDGKRALDWVIRPWSKDLWKDRFRAAAKIAADRFLKQADGASGAEAEELKQSAERVRKATAYVLRHSAISDMVESGELSIHSIAKTVGTSVEMIERHYGHLSRKTRDILNSIGY